MTLSRKHITIWMTVALCLFIISVSPSWAAQVVSIKAETAKDGLQYIGDIVGVFPDTHEFSEDELRLFNIVTIKGSAKDVRAKIRQVTPEIREVFLWETDGEYHWDEGAGPWELAYVYQVDGDSKWYLMVNDFKFPANISSLTPEEKQLLETTSLEAPAVDGFFRKIVKDVTTLPNNNVVIRELKGTSP